MVLLIMLYGVIQITTTFNYNSSCKVFFITGHLNVNRAIYSEKTRKKIVDDNVD